MRALQSEAPVQPTPFYPPALLTGTSSEFLGRKPLPRLLRQRRVVFVLGPQGVGKSTVARALGGESTLSLDTRELEEAVLERVRSGSWGAALPEAPCLVLDGPMWLRNRRGVVSLLAEFAAQRAAEGHRTLFCQCDGDASIDSLIAAMQAGSAVVVGLRFPTGRRARLRCARRLCSELGLPREAAEGSEQLDPWRYDRLVAWLVERAWREP